MQSEAAEMILRDTEEAKYIISIYYVLYIQIIQTYLLYAFKKLIRHKSAIYKMYRKYFTYSW